jgi:CIC family chloride channel protein
MADGRAAAAAPVHRPNEAVSDDDKHSAWWVVGPAVCAVAIVAAAFAIVFRGSLAAVQSLLGARDIVAEIMAVPRWERLVLPAAGGLAAGLIGLVIRRQRGVGGVGYVMEAIVLGRARVPLVRSSLQLVASWLAIVGGNSLGREGPLIQAGAAAGEGARRAFRLSDASARLVLAAGVAAGFAAAYNAPMAATLFVVEVVTGVLVLEAAVPVLIAAVIATVITRFALGHAPLYGLRAFGMPEPVELLAFAGLGLISAPVGVMFLRLLSLADRLWHKIPIPWRPGAGGLVCGAVLVVLPAVAGNGFEPLDELLDGKVAVMMVALLLVAKPFATAASVGSGNPGGVFTPTLLIGGLVGTLYAAGLAALGASVTPGAYALVGLAAALAATTHAPIMSAILACELTGDFGLVLPLLVACALAAVLARRLYIDSVYTAELTRRGLRWRLTLDGRRMIEKNGAAIDVV